MNVRRLLVTICSLALAACSQMQSAIPQRPGAPSAGVKSVTRLSGQHIKHVIIVIQENRSFESFFAGYPGANAPLTGYGIDGKGKRYLIPLQQIEFAQSSNLSHAWSAGIRDWNNGAMDGFSRFGKPGAHQAYSYVDEKQVAPYWDMAQQYVLADEMFPTEFGPSYSAHLTLIAGTDNLGPTKRLPIFRASATRGVTPIPPRTPRSSISTASFTGGSDRIPAIRSFATFADTLDAAHLSWTYYQNKLYKSGIWAPFESMSRVRFGPDYVNDMRYPPPSVLNDIKAGKLAAVTWVMRRRKEDSDHPGGGSDRGPRGRRGRQCDRTGQVLGQQRDRGGVGRLGRPIR